MGKDQDRREFLKATAAGFAALTLFKDINGELVNLIDADPYPELVEATISDLAAQMKAGKMTSRRLVEMYLERIRIIDTRTCSVLELNPDALTIADQMDKERKKGRVRSRLHGIPILIKDNIETADQMHTTAGSWALLDAPTPKKDAFVAERLRKAGAVILGKTNLSEWANFRSTKSISGWSGRGLQTNNPYFLDQNPCGSSSGSGVSVSANLAAAAVGTETNGSIICPSMTNGVVGLKPTVGLISRSGIVPIAHTQDTAGPMTRTVTDAAIMLTTLAGTDKSDTATADADKHREKDYTHALDLDGLKGARLGLVLQYLPQRTREVAMAFYKPFIDKIREAGATLVDVTFPDYSKAQQDRFDVLQYEFKTDLNKYLLARGSKYKTLEELIKFNDDNKDRELQVFGQEIFIDSQKKGPLTDQAYIDAVTRIKKATREDGIDALLAKDKLDAFVGPTAGAAWSIAAVAGYPSITVPLGLREIPGIPAQDKAAAIPASISTPGMFFFGTAWSEAKLLRYAYAFEQRTKARAVPQFLPTYSKKA
ncbi:MAG TPA: amidase [Pyrinomonadaceae bacterium]|jgi:amidase|nr:amidase [Pyrinomonadaceae bacterium]